jgi:hypothetical protein
VHQNQCRLTAAGAQAARDGFLAFPASRDDTTDLRELPTPHHCFRTADVGRRDNQDDLADLPKSVEHSDGPLENRNAAEAKKLLRDSSPHSPAASACCDDHRNIRYSLLQGIRSQM